MATEHNYQVGGYPSGPLPYPLDDAGGVPGAYVAALPNGVTGTIPLLNTLTVYPDAARGMWLQGVAIAAGRSGAFMWNYSEMDGPLAVSPGMVVPGWNILDMTTGAQAQWLFVPNREAMERIRVAGAFNQIDLSIVYCL